MHVAETAFSDYYDLEFFQSMLSKLRTKVIYYRLKIFNESNFLRGLKAANLAFFKKRPNQNYNILTDKFLGIVNKHAPLKKEFVTMR